MKDTNKFVNNKDFGVIARSGYTQQGNENQREWFNGQRDVKQKRNKSGSIIGSTVPGAKVSSNEAKSQGFDVADERKRQRAGGKGN